MLKKLIELRKDRDDPRLADLVEAFNTEFEYLELILTNGITRENIEDCYMFGFNLEELNKGMDGWSISKQGLYSALDRKIENRTEIHRANRRALKQKIKHYFTFDKVNRLGDTESLYDYFNGLAKARHYNEYRELGGIASRFIKVPDSNSSLKTYYDRLAAGEGVELQRELGDKYPSLLSSYYRFRKLKTQEAIMLGDTEMLQYYSVTENYRNKLKSELDDKIRSLYQQYGDKHLFVSYIEDELGIWGVRQYIYDLLQTPLAERM